MSGLVAWPVGEGILVRSGSIKQLNPGATLACHLRLHLHSVSRPTAHTVPILANGVSVSCLGSWNSARGRWAKESLSKHRFCALLYCSESSPPADLPMVTLKRLPRASRGRHTSTAAVYGHNQAVPERTRAHLLRVTRHHVLPRIPLEEKNNLSSRDSHVQHSNKGQLLWTLSRHARVTN